MTAQEIITRQDLRAWNACYSDERIAELVPPGGVTPRQVAEATEIPTEDRLWVLASIPLPEGLAHARLAVIVREAGRHGSAEICERVAVLCDRVAAGESRASLNAEFRAMDASVAWAVDAADAADAAARAAWAAWAANAADAAADEARQCMITGVLAVIEGAV